MHTSHFIRETGAGDHWSEKPAVSAGSNTALQPAGSGEMRKWGNKEPGVLAMRKLVGRPSRKTVQTNNPELVQGRLAHRNMAGVILKWKHSK